MAASRSISSFVATALLLAACGKTPADRELVLGDQVSLTHAKDEAAGVLKGMPYRYRWANFPGAAPLFEAMNAGAIDTGVAGDAPFILAVAANVPTKAIAAMRSTGRAIAVLVPPGSPIRSVADLRGHRVIVSSARGSVAQLLLLEALERAHIRPDQVDIGFMLPTDAAAAFSSGRIDAWATFGSYQATAEAHGAHVLVDGRGISPAVSLIVASDPALADPTKRHQLGDLLQRQARANRWTVEHPDDYARIYAKQTGMPLPIAQTLAGWENPQLLPLDPPIVAELQRTADRFHHFGVIPARVDIARRVDPGLLTGPQASNPGE